MSPKIPDRTECLLPRHVYESVLAMDAGHWTRNTTIYRDTAEFRAYLLETQTRGYGTRRKF